MGIPARGALIAFKFGVLLLLLLNHNNKALSDPVGNSSLLPHSSFFETTAQQTENHMSVNQIFYSSGQFFGAPQNPLELAM